MATPNSKSYGVPLYGASWLPLNLTRSRTNSSQDDSDELPSPIDAGTHVVLSGGGGEGHSGIPNALLVSQFDFTSNSLSDQPVANLGTGVDLPYRIAVHPGGRTCMFNAKKLWFEWDAAERNGVHGWGLKSSMKVLDQLEDVGQQLALTFDDEGSVLAVGGEDGKLRVFKWPSMDTILDESNAHTSVKDLAFRSQQQLLQIDFNSSILQPDGKFLSSVGSDGPIRVWNVALAMPIAALQRETDERFGFSRFSPNNDKHQVLYVMAMQGKGGSIVKWNTTSWTRINSKHIVRDSITAFNVSADGKRLVVGTIEGDILILNSVSMRVQTVVKKAHLGIVTALKFSHDSRALLSASFDSSARVTVMNDEKQSGWSLWVILFIILLGLGLGLGIALYYAESEGLFQSKLQLFVNKM